MSTVEGPPRRLVNTAAQQSGSSQDNYPAVQAADKGRSGRPTANGRPGLSTQPTTGSAIRMSVYTFPSNG